MLHTFANLIAIYEQGGHSKSYAALTLTEPLTSAIAKKTEFSRTRSFAVDGSFLFTGKAYADADVYVGATELKLQYPAGHCQVGGLSATERNLEGCEYLPAWIGISYLTNTLTHYCVYTNLSHFIRCRV